MLARGILALSLIFSSFVKSLYVLFNLYYLDIISQFMN